MLEDLEQDIQLTINKLTPNINPQPLQKSFYKKIHNYELHLYNLNKYNPTKAKQIQAWRQQFRLQLQKYNDNNKTQTRKIVSKEDSDELEETVQLMARQVLKAENNKNELVKSTVKLKSLNVSSKDLKMEIDKTRKSINVRRMNEQKEIFLVRVGFIVFLLVCMFIILDKFGIRRMFF